MVGTYNPNAVSVFHTLDTETVKQGVAIGNTSVNGNETPPLKVLALRVLQRNATKNKAETDSVNPSVICVSNETAWTPEDYHYWHQERAAVFEFEGEYSRAEAEQLAYASILMEFDETELPPELKSKTVIH